MKPPFHGSLVPNITIFKPDGAVDSDRTRWHMEWMIKHGTNGLFCTGSYGAGPLLEESERIAVIQLAAEVAKARPGTVLIPHVGAIDGTRAARLAAAAEKAGAHAVGAVPPFYYKHTEAAILAYYQKILDAVKIPVFAYNNPETSRFTMTFETVQKLQKMGLRGLKDSPCVAGFLSRVQYDAALQNKDFQIIIGTSTGWLPYYQMGIRAMIAGMNNYAPEVITELVRATVAGEERRSQEVYLAMLEISKVMHWTDSTIASHIALYARGFDAGFPKEPMTLPPFSDPKYTELGEYFRKTFARLGLPYETGDWKLPAR